MMPISACAKYPPGKLPWIDSELVIIQKWGQECFLTVRFLAMSDSQNERHLGLVVDVADQPVVSNPVAPQSIADSFSGCDECAKQFLLQLPSRRLVQALRDQYAVALHINDHRTFLCQPGVGSG
jgi:hypothetical protein